MNNITYNRRKANHECTICGEKLPDGHNGILCERCRQLKRESDRYADKLAIKHGMCVSCHIRQAAPGRTRCTHCSEARSQESKRRYARLKASGLCVYCGKRPRGRTILCDECYARKLALNKGE